MTPALLTVSAPTDERGKALYNAVQAVWSPRNKPASPEKIRSGIVGFAETVRNLRDAWKAKNDMLRKAELPNSPTAGDAVALKDEVARYRQVTESVMSRSLLYGHPSIVKRYVVPQILRVLDLRILPTVLQHGFTSGRGHSVHVDRSTKAVRREERGLSPCFSFVVDLPEPAAQTYNGLVDSYGPIDSLQVPSLCVNWPVSRQHVKACLVPLMLFYNFY